MGSEGVRLERVGGTDSRPLARVFLALLLAPLLLVSCSENDTQEEEFPNWQEQNDAYFRNIYNKAMTNTDGSWKIIKSYAYEDTVPHDITANIVVEVLKEGTASGSPLFTDSVKVSLPTCRRVQRDMCSTAAIRATMMSPQLAPSLSVWALWLMVLPQRCNICT